MRLTISEKRRILTTHIFGVDIDPQAVEVTKLSLLLKVLEGETADGIAAQMHLFNQRVLPDLGGNIRCGNSLIEGDFYGFFAATHFTEDQLHKINVFTWKKEFPDVFKEASGFDVVIGNPPYGAVLLNEEKRYLLNHYPNQTYQLDSYLLFIERAIELLLKPRGMFGMIIPNPWLTNVLQTKIRNYVLSNTAIKEIVHFTFPVFAKAKATVDTEIVILQKGRRPHNHPKAFVISAVGPDGTINTGAARIIDHDQNNWTKTATDPINIFLGLSERSLATKIRDSGQPLGLSFNTNVGMKPYQVGKGTPKQKRSDVENRVFDANRKISSDYRQYLRGTDIIRFLVAPVERRYIRFGPWLAEPRPSAKFDAPTKIVMRQTGDSLIAAIDRGQYVCMNNMHVLVPNDIDRDMYYYLGVTNSRLMNWYYQSLNPEMGEALAEVKKTNVERLPIPTAPNSEQQRISDLAKQIEAGLADFTESAAESTRAISKRRLTAMFEQMNAAIYRLYKLTPDEIEIVEIAQRHIIIEGR